ncbi:Catabolite control protein [Serratia entomophila]|jgi:DNA-binding LacI/PurR family transcriptional regulator|nr:Catabolite control protein [Serratia entomophila]CAI0709952.1 Catabolite control protein [Serratia entomophila]CAI0711072.1 Catabolite control protein [Serratia entomophila]CAI0726761.1 Catabolite control protein [Serratia entomophila]CAI0727234.1 Catabolite control protein [Serratia entomophila]
MGKGIDTMANIRDVARLAGVSISSVSNVLNNRTGQMSEETRLRIERAMEALDYRPFRPATPRDNEQAKIIGLLVPSIINPSFSALAHAVDSSARAYRYRVLLGNSYRREDEESAFIEDMFAHGVRGIIVAASDIRKTHFVRAAERGMMIVSYDNRFSDSMAEDTRLFDSVSMDNAEAGRLAAQHLIERGCQDVVFATEATLTMSRNHKIEGFLAALRHHRLPLRQRVIEGKARSEYGDSEMFELGLTLAAKILALQPRPDGIVAINDALGIGLMAGLRAAGVRVPAEVSIVGIDNISLSGLADPGLTSVMPPLAEMAQLMVERLVSRINNHALPPGEFLFPPSFISRQSVRNKTG